ncbi:ABC transporter ATP-binding protein [Amycolatopsis magusensis]|uniref:ABC transporter ATP-binding protein n=1 Tax=Amycolatopsis magusensis TaxID=882444 RepID=UPI0037B675DA
MSGVAGIVRIVRTSVRISPLATVFCLLETAAQLLYVLQPLFLGWLLSGLTGSGSRYVVQGVVGLVASLGLSTALRLVGINTRLRQMERIGHVLDTAVADATARVPTLAHLENPEFLDRTQILRDHQGVLGGTFNQLVAALTMGIGACATVVLAAALDWRLLLLVTASVPRLALTRWLHRAGARAELAAAEPGRLTGDLVGLCLSARSAAEIRVYGMGSRLRAVLRQSASGWLGPGTRLGVRQSLLSAGQLLLFCLTTAIVLTWMARDVGASGVAPTALGAAVLMVGRLNGVISTAVASLGTIGQLLRNAERFEWLLSFADRSVSRARTGTEEAVAGPVVLRNVCFRYRPGADFALREVNLTIEPGSTVAIVGDNGAGKSTLVKLVCGLYKPTCGTVRAGSVDIHDLAPGAWAEQLTGAFQDYLRLEVAAGEAVGVGDLSAGMHAERIGQALRSARAEAMVSRLPEQLRTQLGAHWPGGIDLSSGQWQSLALARAMMRPAARLLVLDEPTAALDAEAEHAAFEHYKSLAAGMASWGASAVLVTHRFSSAAIADHIVVLRGGAIIEEGSHGNLMERAGEYARQYSMQAAGYARDR